MKLRSAKPKDFDMVCAMALKLHEHFGLGLAQHYNQDFFHSNYLMLINTPQGYAQILDYEGDAVGVLLASLGRSIFSRTLVTEEHMWWIEPEVRGRNADLMLQDYEEWASAIGARLIGITTYDQRVAKLYQRRGYQPGEFKHYKVLS